MLQGLEVRLLASRRCFRASTLLRVRWPGSEGTLAYLSYGPCGLGPKGVDSPEAQS